MILKKYIKKNAFKIVLGGEGGVGKTTFSRRLTRSLKINEDIKMTPGVDFHSLKNDIVLWDLGGQTQFRFFQKDFFNSATIVILIFSVDMYHTFKNLREWLNFIPKKMVIKIYLIGNKIDTKNRTVKTEEALEFANNHDLSYCELSSLNGVGFEEFEQDLLETIENICNSNK